MPSSHLPSSVKAVCLAYRLTGTDMDAVAGAYEVITAGAAPLIVLAASSMLPDLRRDADAGYRIVFVGRDGLSLARAIRGLDRGFFEAHCSEVMLSRAVTETALQDLEVNAGENFPQLAGFRHVRGTVAARHITGSYRKLTAYLNRARVPAGVPGAGITIVDNGLKGTVQELLAASYPHNRFRGRYLVYLAAPGDPHPGSKKGYLIHRSGPGWTGLPLPVLPADPALTFACRDAIKVLEDILHGTMTSPAAWSGNKPRQKPQRLVRDQLAGLNPALVDPAYTSPAVREAVKAAAMLAVYDTAVRAARERAGGRDWQSPLRVAAGQFTSDVRAWISGRPVSNPGLRVLLDSFVRRADQDINRQVARAFRRAGLSPGEALPTWRALASADSLFRKQQLADAAEESLTRHLQGYSIAPAVTRVPPLSRSRSRRRNQVTAAYRLNRRRIPYR